MKTKISFGEFFKARRGALGVTLREFCIKHDLDPGNMSRLEHGLLPPPQDRARLEQYARFLELAPGSDDWYTLFDLAATTTGRMPQELLEDQEVVTKLPMIFRALREKRLTDEELNGLVKMGPADLSTVAVPLKITGKQRFDYVRGIWRGIAVAISTSLFVAALTFSIARFRVPATFTITNAVMCQDFDEERRPVGVVSVFPEGTESVRGCFSWTGATSPLQVIGRWYHVPEGVRILDVPVTLTGDQSHGIISLKMPSGKALPPGSYRLDLMVKGKVVKTVPFTVAASPSSLPTASK